MLSPDDCYGALRARDARFDGLFFVGVSTTGIYCRPICPARTPSRSRCTFFQRAAEAERAGYRACFRCRPEVAPGTPHDQPASVDVGGYLARRAAALIEAGFLDGRSVDELAARLGVTARHLRRVVDKELGASPVELAQVRRLALARQLLHDTTLPLAEVALAAGFGSVRRFDALFAARFRRRPSELRRRSLRTRAPSASPADPVHLDPQRPAGEWVTLRLDYRPPLAWEALLAFLGARAIPGVERVEAGRYRRVVVVRDEQGGQATGWLEVGAAEARRSSGRSSLQARLSLSLSRRIPLVVARLRSLLDLDARPDRIAAQLATDGRFASSLRLLPGLRVPGAFDGFEMAVCALLGRHVSVRAATTLCGRLVEGFGEPIDGAPAGLHRIFPSAARLAALSVEELRGVGLRGARAETLRLLARAVASGRLDLDAPILDEQARRATLTALESIPGIGRWTSNYLAMRALRWPDAFVAGDLVVRRALGVAGEREAEAASMPWRPFRAYAVMHLWSGAAAAASANPTERTVPDVT